MDERVAAGLAETVRALRGELQEAMAVGQSEELQFELSQVQLELILAITRAASGDAGIRFWVVSIGAGLEASNVSTHRLSLSMTPTLKGSHQTSVRIAGQSPQSPE